MEETMNVTRRTGDKMMDLITGKILEIASVKPAITFTDGTAMKNPECYAFEGNNNPFPIPTNVVINDDSLIIDEKKVETGRYHCTRCLNKFEDGVLLEALSKDQKHKMLLEYLVSTDRFSVASEHAADVFDVIYDDDKYCFIRSRREDEVETEDEDGNTVTYHPEYETIYAFRNGSPIETVNADEWAFGDIEFTKLSNGLPVLVLASNRKYNENHEPVETENSVMLTRLITTATPSEEECEMESEDGMEVIPEYDVAVRQDLFLGTPRKIAMTPENGVFVVGDKSILYSGSRKRWANGNDVADIAMDYPHMIKMNVDGDTTTFTLADDSYSTVRVVTEATSDRGLVSTIVTGE